MDETVALLLARIFAAKALTTIEEITDPLQHSAKLERASQEIIAAFSHQNGQ